MNWSFKKTFKIAEPNAFCIKLTVSSFKVVVTKTIPWIVSHCARNNSMDSNSVA